MPSHPLPGFALDAVVSALPAPAQVYVVGGAVRDALLGMPSSDRDWVVVGASPQAMLDAGFRPVGSDFPVFLHPHTQEEYALARTERKSGHGYKGFVFHADASVSLEQDLQRRDFTINAMAMDAHGRLIDPYGGLDDLRQGLFRHVSMAFSEDPLRVLRLARFLARFHEFRVSPSTLALCCALREAGELQHLVAERVFAELNRGMAEPKPSQMVQFLQTTQAWPALSGGLAEPFTTLGRDALGLLDTLPTPEQRWLSALGLRLQAALIAPLAEHWRMPTSLADSARVVADLKAFVQQPDPTLTDWVALFNQLDVYRKPERLQLAAQVVSAAEGSQAALVVVQQACQQMMGGQYKAGLRAAMQNQQGRSPADVAQLHKQHWVQQLLNTV
ncbi:hypothetical protein [Limnobacter sp.]|uniref:hypothetical protein n=1 Tax=Limnobacter sp. TaxID=2003368 RepID=UPI003516A4DD